MVTLNSHIYQVYTAKKLTYHLDSSHLLASFTSLTHLTFGDSFNQPLRAFQWSRSLTHLTFGCHFNQSRVELPHTLTHLKFGHNFNHKIILPPSLSHLTFGENFNRYIFPLPDCMTHLTFGNSFNQFYPLFPSSLTHLTFGKNYNHKLDPPPFLQSLKIGYHFNSQIIVFPDTLTELRMESTYFSEPLPRLPLSLHTLCFSTFGSKYPHPLTIPRYIKKLSLPVSCSSIVALPTQLEKLRCYNIELPLPETLLKLTYLGGDPCPDLPPSLQHLSIGIANKHPLPPLPHSLVYLTWGGFTINVRNHWLRSDLDYLKFRSSSTTAC